MALKRSQTIDTLCSADMRAMIILIKKHTYTNADILQWIHPISFSSKDNSYENRTWDEAMNGTHKDGYQSECKKEINTLNKKQAWGVVDLEDWMNVLHYSQITSLITCL